jgi:hypothetical protein
VTFTMLQSEQLMLVVMTHFYLWLVDLVEIFNILLLVQLQWK